MPTTATGRGNRRAIHRAAALLVLLIVSTADLAGGQTWGRSADQDLRVDWTAGADRRGRPLVSGYVYNQRAGSYASSVRLLVEGLDASDHLIGSATGVVFGDVPPSDRSYFEVRAPAGAASYRVTIQTFAWRAYGAGGG